MGLHHVREGRLDQRITVNQRPVEVKNQAALVSVGASVEAGGGRVGSKKRLWFCCHVSSTSLGWLRSPGSCVVDESTLPNQIMPVIQRRRPRFLSERLAVQTGVRLRFADEPHERNPWHRQPERDTQLAARDLDRDRRNQ